MILADFLSDVFEKEHRLNRFNGYWTDFFWMVFEKGTLNPASGSLILVI